MQQLQFMTLFFYIFKNGFLFFLLLLFLWQWEMQTPPNSFVMLTQEIVFNLILKNYHILLAEITTNVIS